MAERRMFAKAIIDSDAFIEMPVSARLLYYDLGMRGDDDGFVNSPKKIMKMIGASDDDLRILITKKFIIPFESGIVVIKHWRINNYLRNDRYKETTYLDEKAMLKIEDNGAYHTNFTPGIPTLENGIPGIDKRETQDRLDQDSIDKTTIQGKVEEKIPYQLILEKFKLICFELPKPQRITKERRKHINARWNDIGGTIEFWDEYFNRIHESAFLNNRGTKNRNDWTADFDWVINETHMTNILEGKYNNKDKMTPISKEDIIIQNLRRQAEEY